MQKRRESVPRGPQFTAEGRQRQEEFWRRLVRAQHDSGLTRAEFCRRRSVPEGQFSWWRRELRRRDGKGRRAGPDAHHCNRSSPPATGSLVPVRIRPEPAPCDGMIMGQGDSAPQYEIVLPSGCVVRLRSGYVQAELEGIMRVARGGC